MVIIGCEIFANDKKRKARLGAPFLDLSLAITHLADEDPDEPESASDAAHECVTDEVPESILPAHDVSFRCGVVYYMVGFFRERRFLIVKLGINNPDI